MKLIAKLISLITAVAIAISFFEAGYNFTFIRILKRQFQNQGEACAIGIIGNEKPFATVKFSGTAWAVSIAGIIASLFVGKPIKLENKPE